MTSPLTWTFVFICLYLPIQPLLLVPLRDFLLHQNLIPFHKIRDDFRSATREACLDGPGIESQWGRDIPPVQTGPGAHPASCKVGTGSFPGVKYGRGVTLTTHPLLVPWSWKIRAIPLPTLWYHSKACNGEPLHLHFYKGRRP